MTEQSVHGPFGAELREIAAKLAAPGRGILAADESTATVGKRLSSINVENNEPNRLALRRMLFSTEGLQEYVSGVILFEETLYQKLPDGKPIVSLLTDRDIILGIKVDKGVVPLAGTEGETTTQGLDDLAKRCEQYRAAGARFAKWRAVLKIGPGAGCPSQRAIGENARSLARYASVCQQAGLVPIVEPEILTDGSHSSQLCARETERVLAEVVKALHDHGVLFEGMLLKCNMVTAGVASPQQSSPEEVAALTVRALRRTLPPACAGVNFLSGGQSEEEATRNLDAMNRLSVLRPWPLSFSFGRALQASAIKAWGGKEEQVAAAQAVFLDRCKANSLATLGKYTAGGSHADGSGEKLFVADYAY